MTTTDQVGLPDAGQPTKDPVPEMSRGYAEALNDLRGTARWLVAAGGGLAAALVAGLQLRDLPALGQDRMLAVVVAFGAAGTALLLAIALVLQAARVLAAPRLSVNDLADIEMVETQRQGGRRLEPLQDDVAQHVLNRKTDLLHGEASIDAFYRRFVTSSDPVLTVHARQVAVARVEDAAHFFGAEKRFTALLQHFKLSGAIFVVCVLTFAIATADRPAPGANVTQPVPVVVQLSDRAAAELGPRCPRVVMGFAIGGNLRHPTLVTVGMPECPARYIEQGPGVVATPRSP